MEDPLAIKCLNSWKINIERQSHEDLNLSYIMKQENATKDNVIQCSGSNQQEERHVTLNIINQILNDNKISSKARALSLSRLLPFSHAQPIFCTKMSSAPLRARLPELGAF